MMTDEASFMVLLALFLLIAYTAGMGTGWWLRAAEARRRRLEQLHIEKPKRYRVKFKYANRRQER